ncbi:hypothetical protein [Streptomyces noursei]|uniref:hypothetical protein n=1 Tax=Streptomyces noursei TaxID=1971 RepID=UPI0035AB8375
MSDETTVAPVAAQDSGEEVPDDRRRTRLSRFDAGLSWLTHEAVEAVEDDAVDQAQGEVGEELTELGPQDDPVDGAVGLGDLALLERGGVVLPADLGERAPAEAGSAVFGILELAVHAGLQAEAVGGDAEVGGGPLR